MRTVSLSLFLVVLLGLTTACAGSGAQPGQSSSRDRNVITFEQIENSEAPNAFELVRALRPQWLRPRGAQTVHETAKGVGGGTGPGAAVVYTPAPDMIVVYLDKARLGGVNDLRQIDLRAVRTIEWLDVAAANYRFGPGHHHGVILLMPR
jgi:hypothetical protein